MAHVITDTGTDLGDVTDPGALAYYQREPGFTIDGVEVLASEAPQDAAVEPDPPVSDAPPYDPAEHTVDEVLDYLADADDSEHARVLAAEEAGKARKGILEIEAPE